MKVEALFREDSYLTEVDAKVAAVVGGGGIVLDRTVFYATSGGQPGDSGWLERRDGTRIGIAATTTGESKDHIIHVPDASQPQLAVGEEVIARIDWERRHRLMRLHTACHLLSVVCPYPVTGASINNEDARIDFDMEGATADKEETTRALMELVTADHPVYIRTITEEELAANPGLIKSKNVRPPSTGQVRLVCIGENGSVDSQPCGGTHVRTTGEIGEVHIGKIEKKGRENRRFRLRFGPMPA
ncbi:alanyl-tRNA editing protein [Limoniibacter endophyticus]|uniref:Alanine--tRNA ligase n=1 Tax=Limoniibacter endophyticus TaxID=1565040 RepID=A0A8J3GFC6_9HYPH|nr:alanyl-tRNA editing protein [Limoniibacter endophyticus]GHC61917.1 serine-tRNA(Ala) deacylase AlaX [Limoniibacter endophyticus]